MKGPRWLEKKEIAEIVKRDLHYYDGKDYQLLAYCIMPNHVHMVLVIMNHDKPFYAILQSLKRHSAREANKTLNRVGNPFWHEESYDHVVRNSDELNRVIRYVLDNPVKAGLVKNWDDWKYNYFKL